MAEKEQERPAAIGRGGRGAWTADPEAVAEALFRFEQVIGLMGAAFAHELNNRLQGVIGFLDLLVRTEPNAERRRDLEYALNATLECRTFAKRTGDLSERYPPRLVELRLEPLLRSVFAACARVHEAAQVDLSVQVPAEIVCVRSEPVLLVVGVYGLLDNAFRAAAGNVGRKGRIGVSCSVVEGGTWAVAVTDDGKGGQPEVLQRAGQPFVSDRQGPGMGVGLWLARRAAKILGGQMEVSSNGPGLGTVSVLRFPLESSEPAA